MDKKRLKKLKNQLENKDKKIQQKKEKGTEKLYYKIWDLIIKNINRSEINIDFIVTMDINYDYYLDAITVEKSKKIIGKTYIDLFDLTLKLQNYGLSLDYVYHYVEKELLKIAWKIQVNTYDLKALIVENDNLISKPKTRIKVK